LPPAGRRLLRTRRLPSPLRLRVCECRPLQDRFGGVGPGDLVTALPPTDLFPREIAGLPHSGRPEMIELSDGDAFDLRIARVVKRIGDATVRMLAYNGSIPGPTLKVQQGDRKSTRLN